MRLSQPTQNRVQLMLYHFMQRARTAATRRLDGMVPLSFASRAMGAGGFRGHGGVCTGSTIADRLCSAVRMLL